jgi:mannose-6-phosphate isomerase-like protein (cupin superfamily)
MRLTRLCAALAAAMFAACASSTPEHAAVAPEHAAQPPPVLDALLGERLVVPLSELPQRVPLAPDQDFRVEPLGASEHTSHHVGAIRRAEPLHRHDRHDLLVLIVRGRGTQRVGDETRAVGEGSLLFVPRGVVHAFTNTGPEPAIAYLVYSPPFDGRDRVLVEAP